MVLSNKSIEISNMFFLFANVVYIVALKLQYQMISKSNSQTRIFQHVLFWSIAFVFLLLIIFVGSGFRNVFQFKPLFITLVFNLCFGAAVYTNLYLLMPLFLKKKRFVTYGILLLITVGIVSVFIDFLLVYPFKHFLGQVELFEKLSVEVCVNFVIFTFVYVGVTTFLSLIREWFTLQKISVKLKDAEKAKLEAELKILKTQINPHFLFNTLNNLYSLTLDKSDKAPDLVLKLSDMMRYILYECSDKFVPLEKEVAFLQGYFDLQRIRLDEAIPLSFEIKGEIAGKTIAPLLLEPLIENAFKHGVYRKNSGGFVAIVFNLEEENIIGIEIKNKKESQWDEENKKEGGIGLQNVKRRLDLLYPKKYQLDIDDQENEFTVQLKIKINSKNLYKTE